MASQVEYLKRLSDELLRQAERQRQGERIPRSEAEAIWQEMAEDRPDWISSHTAEGFREYVEDRRKRFRLPVE